MPARQPKPTSIVLCLILLVAGVGLWGAMIGITASLGRTRIQLQREAGSVRGSIAWVFGGVPVYWRSLDGLSTVQRDDYRVRESGSGVRPVRTVGRLSFRNAAGEELVWVERTYTLNQQEALERFLSSERTTELEVAQPGAARFEYVEPVSGNLGDRLKGWAVVILCGFLCGLGGLLCILAGALSLVRRLGFLPPASEHPPLSTPRPISAGL